MNAVIVPKIIIQSTLFTSFSLYSYYSILFDSRQISIACFLCFLIKKSRQMTALFFIYFIWLEEFTLRFIARTLSLSLIITVAFFLKWDAKEKSSTKTTPIFSLSLLFQFRIRILLVFLSFHLILQNMWICLQSFQSYLYEL